MKRKKKKIRTHLKQQKKLRLQVIVNPSKKTKKQKQAIVCETKESESYEESLPEGNIDKAFKQQRENPSRKTKSSHKKKYKRNRNYLLLPTLGQKRKQKCKKLQGILDLLREKCKKITEVSITLEPKGKAQVAAIKLSNKVRKSKEGKNECEIDESTKTKQLLLEDNAVNTTDPNTNKKNEHVCDEDIELMKVKPDGETSINSLKLQLAQQLELQDLSTVRYFMAYSHRGDHFVNILLQTNLFATKVVDNSLELNARYTSSENVPLSDHILCIELSVFYHHYYYN
ncbi:hypothetical protein MtrunA17_Chr4g0056751 [Medicago truncatula]|uniref:Uncharacterized protein n=1 Tax=Medicago truncatula TaxID=3880 RepID=A0A396IGC1_MEDTR|nr:hypothetical protein MtrunA17_Chr4g0056751 [Medicago truncatula]